MYRHILIPTDGSTAAEKGVDHGIELAAALDGTVHPLFVIEEGANPWLAEPMDEQFDRAREYGQDILDEVVDQAAEAGVEAETAIEGSPKVAEAITEYAEEHGIDLIVMGTGYRGALGGLLGSTAEKVVRSASVPVTTVRQGGFD